LPASRERRPLPLSLSLDRTAPCTRLVRRRVWHGNVAIATNPVQLGLWWTERVGVTSGPVALSKRAADPTKKLDSSHADVRCRKGAQGAAPMAHAAARPLQGESFGATEGPLGTSAVRHDCTTAPPSSRSSKSDV